MNISPYEQRRINANREAIKGLIYLIGEANPLLKEQLEQLDQQIEQYNAQINDEELIALLTGNGPNARAIRGINAAYAAAGLEQPIAEIPNALPLKPEGEPREPQEYMRLLMRYLSNATLGGDKEGWDSIAPLPLNEDVELDLKKLDPKNLLPSGFYTRVADENLARRLGNYIGGSFEPAKDYALLNLSVEKRIQFMLVSAHSMLVLTWVPLEMTWVVHQQTPMLNMDEVETALRNLLPRAHKAPLWAEVEAELTDLVEANGVDGITKLVKENGGDRWTFEVQESVDDDPKSTYDLILTRGMYRVLVGYNAGQNKVSSARLEFPQVKSPNAVPRTFDTEGFHARQEFFRALLDLLHPAGSTKPIRKAPGGAVRKVAKRVSAPK